MRFDLTPSTRKGGAQRMLSTTTLICEACVVFFATLAAFGLEPDARGLNTTLGLMISVALALVSGLFNNGKAWPYWLGLALQVPVLAYGFVVGAMFYVGLAFAVLYWWGLVKGHSMDAEKDEIDAKVLAQEARRENRSARRQARRATQGAKPGAKKGR